MERLEQAFFASGPQFFRLLGVGFALLSLAIGLALYFSDAGRLDAQQMRAVGGFGLPAVVSFLLSVSIARRHLATVPLMALLSGCLMFLYDINPREVADGISPYTPVLVGVWMVRVILYAGVLAMFVFVLHLWRKGSYR